MKMSWLISAVIALLLFSLWGIILKYSTGKIDAISFSMFNAVTGLLTISIVFGWFWFSKSQLSITGEGINIALVAGVVGILAVLFEAIALKTGNLAIVGPLIAVGVAAMVTIAGVLVFNETLTLKSGVGVLLALISIILLST